MMKNVREYARRVRRHAPQHLPTAGLDGGPQLSCLYLISANPEDMHRGSARSTGFIEPSIAWTPKGAEQGDNNGQT